MVPPYANLSLSTQIMLVSLLVLFLMAVIARSLIFVRRERKGFIPYPLTWSSTQRLAFRYFRLAIGAAILILWGVFHFIAPSMPKTWPFSYIEAISLLVLLMVSYAWVALLAPATWGKAGSFSPSFRLTIAFFVVWWLTMFVAVGWMLSATTSIGGWQLLTGAYA